MPCHVLAGAQFYVPCKKVSMLCLFGAVAWLGGLGRAQGGSSLPWVSKFGASVEGLHLKVVGGQHVHEVENAQRLDVQNFVEVGASGPHFPPLLYDSSAHSHTTHQRTAVASLAHAARSTVPERAAESLRGWGGPGV
eukprot:COSAG01_NODE_4789_length_4742_cov_2.795822_6_plen_137_part_00